MREWVPGGGCFRTVRGVANGHADPRVHGVLTRRCSHARSPTRSCMNESSRSLGSRFGWWAVEVSGVAPFVGYVGLTVPTFEAEFTPCVEIGWRLAHTYWGNGYATEAARVALAFGFDEVCLEEIVSFTVRTAAPSRSWSASG